MEETLINFAEGAFSIAVAGFLLVRMERRLDELTSAIARLESAITGMSAR
ncbi:MAG: YvrJ family protein [Synergistaceae bacterium]|nr:YvrJ family protein [Synergistaceae bacterium]